MFEIFLYRYLDAGRDMVTSLQYGARCPCGYCHISDVEFHKQEDHMESFFLAETVRKLFPYPHTEKKEKETITLVCYFLLNVCWIRLNTCGFFLTWLRALTTLWKMVHTSKL